MSEPIINVEYSYSSKDEGTLDRDLSSMQADIGGQRCPWGGRAGAIDLVIYLELILTFVAGATLGEAIKSYFAGLAGADKAKQLGEHHRETILNWLSNVKNNIQRIVSSIRSRLQEGLRAPHFEGMEEPIALRIRIGLLECYIILNGHYVTDEALDHLPEAVSVLLRFLAEIGLPKDATVIQLCPDPKSCEWRYLLVPSNKAFGHFVDRIIDLTTGKQIHIHRRQEFIDLLGATPEEGIKFLVDPFRYPDQE
jgi:hypothetical protein